MLQSLMSKPVNWDRLNQAGITPNGCDFVQRMLVHEPGDRASDAECLRHAWLAHLRPNEGGDVEMKAQDEGLSAIPEEVDEGQQLDASQLSLHDPADADDSLEYDDGNEVEEAHEPKRVKTDCPRAMGFEPRTASGVSLGSDYSGSWYDTFPMFINAGSRPVGVGAPTRVSDSDNNLNNTNNNHSHRLFGEIGASAIGSSGVFGRDAHAALDLAAQGSRDASVAMSDDTSPANTESHVTNDEISEHSLPYPQFLPATTYNPTGHTGHAGAAPSLLGAEALVGQLNMASSDSVASAASGEAKSRSSRDPRSRGQSPVVVAAVAGSKRSGQNTDAPAQSKSSKRSKKEPDADHVPRGNSRSHDSSAAHGSSRGNKSSARAGNNMRAEAQTDRTDQETTKSHPSHSSHRASSKSASHNADAGKENGSRHSRRSHQDSSSKPAPDVAEVGERPSSRQSRHSHQGSSSKPASELAEVGKELRAQESRPSHRSSSKTTADKAEISKERSSDRSHRSDRGSSKPAPDPLEGEKVSGSHRSDRHHRESKSKKAPDGAEADTEEDSRQSHRSSKSTRKETVRAPDEDTNIGAITRGNESKGSKGSAPVGKEKSQDKSAKAGPTKTSKTKSQGAPSVDSQNSTANSNSSASSAHQPLPPNDSFVRPPPIFGKLTTLPNSVISTTVKLTQRLTYYGRGENCTIFYPNHMDIRVPRSAFDITFWRPGLERDLAKGYDWTKDDSIQAIISTRTNRWIIVNGVKVTRGADCWQFGKLHTGDVITVFDDQADGKPSTDFFKLECSFNIGISKARRPEGEPFVVEQERDHYQKVYGESSRKQAKEEKKKAKEDEQNVETSGVSDSMTTEGPAFSEGHS